MSEIFATEILVNKSRNISNLKIQLGKDKRKHLIITGKNGVGKSSLLLEINKFLEKVIDGSYSNFEQSKTSLHNIQANINHLVSREDRNSPDVINSIEMSRKQAELAQNFIDSFGGTEIKFSDRQAVCENTSKGNFLVAYFDSKRTTQLKIPSGINKVDFKDKYSPREKIGDKFIQYIVNLKAERSFARDDGDSEEAARIDNWFNIFEKNLRDIFEIPLLKLEFDRKKFNFKLSSEGRESYTFSELSDGHSAIFSILTELMLRMDAKGSGNYNMPGIVLIDEIETHLHVDLQKKILPFLSDFFPKIQFITTTHSPFVLSSIENAVICDLQSNMITEDLSGYSYDALIESFFSSDKYSKIIQEKIARFEELSEQKNSDNLEEYIDLEMYLSSLPKYLSQELHAKLQQIELSRLSKRG